MKSYGDRAFQKDVRACAKKNPEGASMSKCLKSINKAHCQEGRKKGTEEGDDRGLRAGPGCTVKGLIRLGHVWGFHTGGKKAFGKL